MDTRGHRVKSKRNQHLGVTKNQQLRFRKVIKSMRGDLGTLGVL